MALHFCCFLEFVGQHSPEPVRKLHDLDFVDVVVLATFVDMVAFLQGIL